MRNSRMSFLTKLTFENTPFTPGSVLDYQPGAKKVSIYPALESSGFPDVVGVDIPLRSKAPANLFSNGWAAWLEIGGVKRAFFAISANGDFIECNSETPPTGSQWLIIQADTTGKVEAVKCFPVDFGDPAETMKLAAIMYQFEAQAKPITTGKTTILQIDRERLVHNFTAEMSAPGVSFSVTAPVSEIRAKKFDVEGFRYWKRAFVWPNGSGKALIAQTTLGGYHVATFSPDGEQKFSERANLFSAALISAHRQLHEL